MWRSARTGNPGEVSHRDGNLTGGSQEKREITVLLIYVERFYLFDVIVFFHSLCPYISDHFDAQRKQPTNT